ncbi:response regulator [bacterium]|nr:response regulator [bacterium]
MASSPSSSVDIILVEDDAEIRAMVSDLLREAGWQVRAVGDAATLERAMADGWPRLFILDINLPGEDGLSICRRISTQSAASILMLTARSDDLDRVIGLEVGADDYLGKPFYPRELVARVRALLRRQSRTPDSPEAARIEVAHLVIDKPGRQVTDSEGQDLNLSSAEFDLFVLLAEARGRVLSRDFLLDAIHGRESHYLDRSIDMLVSRLRRKIDRDGPTLIEGVRNAGYVLRAPTET